ncbi:MAG TPA: MBL fold metallo-hydrolase [Chloroflexota bacterium]|nr:MBL fold metallo-hydrolase [Chloroflexota bacterium]
MEQIAENIYIETAYEGVNVGAVITGQGIIAIDAPTYPRQARDWAMRLQTLSPRPVIFTILTDYHSDRILNARWLNAPIITHRVTAEKLDNYIKRYPANLLENMAARNPYRSREAMSGTVEKAAVSFTKSFHLHNGGVHLQLLAAPGPTSGNLWVHLPAKGILFTGDTFTTGQHPLLLEPVSHQWLQTLQRLDNWPHTLHAIVPGRGDLQTENSTAPICNYLQQMQAQVKSHVMEGKTREETAVYIPEFLELFPTDNLPLDWLRQQIKCSLDHIYDEIQLAGRAA